MKLSVSAWPSRSIRKSVMARTRSAAALRHERPPRFPDRPPPRAAVARSSAGANPCGDALERGNPATGTELPVPSRAFGGRSALVGAQPVADFGGQPRKTTVLCATLKPSLRMRGRARSQT